MGKLREICKSKLGKQWPILLIAAVGLLLLLLPELPEKTSGEAEPSPVQITEQSMEKRLEEVLSLVKGAGRVKVLLTEESGERQIYQTDTEESLRDGETQVKIQTVLAGTGSGTEEPISIGEEGAVYRGALVVSQGADDASVQLALTRAVASVTGLGADKITVIKME